MKIAYIAHAIGGNVQQNLANLIVIITVINCQRPDIVPFAPYYADVVALPDNIPENRARGLQNCQEILRRPGIIDELWLCGEKLTEGMVDEIRAAIDMNIPIHCQNFALLEQYSNFLKTHYPNHNHDQLINLELIEL